ncbi:MAG TPA: T9SS type A sorting domain-containing protein [Chitinophagales bacterium]|nr:T9SS type A sorting domain-containing protein [Chitinophagales bacterium]
MRKFVLVGFFAIMAAGVSAQEVLRPLSYNPVLRNLNPAENTGGTRDIGTSRDTLCLPFFDDFSNLSRFLDSTSILCGDTVFNSQPSAVYPSNLFWTDSLAFVNNTYPILPPSYGVATLDGLRANGRPHSDLIVNGPADTLTSRPVFLGGSLTDSVYLSFSYQPGGFGDFPELNDSLILEYKMPDNSWQRVWFTRNTEGDVNQPFRTAMVPVADEFQYDGFQFRFRNWANVQGNNDHWNIDYVYLADDRSYTDTLFRDVSFVGPPTSILRHYRQMPWNQFRNHQAEELDDNHLAQIINNFNTVINTSYQYRAFETWTGTEIEPLSAPISINFDPFSTAFNSYSTFEIPSSTPGYDGDSLSVTIEYMLDPAGDIERLNDTLRIRQDFYNYFAYDDGSAEKAYALNGTGSKLAVRFHANEPDTLKEIYIHWAYVDGPKSNLFFSLMVWDVIDTTGASADESILYQADFLTPKYVDSVNGFYVYQLTDYLGNPTPVVVNGYFYVGWLQTQSDFLNVGFDVNNVANNDVFYTTGGNWTRSDIPGAIMIRPQVGGNYSVVDDVHDVQTTSVIVFPNPATAQISMSGMTEGDRYEIFSSTGVLVDAGIWTGDPVEITDLASGMYLLRAIHRDGDSVTTSFIKQHTWK